MNLESLNSVITDNLLINVDLSDEASWNLNDDLTVTSLVKWSKAKSDNINLKDFGLASFDNGFTDKMWEGIIFTPSDNLFKMNRVGYNDVINPTITETSGSTITTNYYTINSVIDNDKGNYFDLNGGYLQGFFKLDEYNYELLPSRYGNGITIETMLYLNNNSSGIFYMMGARSEDKYNPSFSGETGVTNSNGEILNSLIERKVLRNAFRKPEEDMYETEFIESAPINNLVNNVISFSIDDDKYLEYKYVGENGLVNEDSSLMKIPTTGWTLITITYVPDEVVSDNELLTTKRRNGKLTFYVNGQTTWVVNDFPEFYFNRINNKSDLQLGIPYSISFGGGSYGLADSWHYDYQTYKLYDGGDDTYININYDSDDDIILSENSDIFDNTVMLVKYVGNDSSNVSVRLIKNISTLSNREYNVEMDIFVDNIFGIGDGTIKLNVESDDTEIITINETMFYHPIPINNGVSGSGKWVTLKNTFKTTDNSGKNLVKLSIVIEGSTNLNNNSNLYISRLEYSAPDILVKDVSKTNLTIEQNFNSSFIGGIQKLRIYDKSLSSLEILHNASYEGVKNDNIIVNKGGRIIRRR